MSRAREVGDLGSTVTVDASGNIAVGGSVTANGGAALQSDGVTSSVMVSAAFGPVTLSASGVWYSIGGLTLPSSGLWRIDYQSRFGGNNLACFVVCQLSTAASSSGLFGSPRMVLERVQQQSASLNIGGLNSWYIDVANGNTGGATIYILGKFDGTAGSAFFQDDSNGQTGVIATKLRESTTSGTSISSVTTGF